MCAVSAESLSGLKRAYVPSQDSYVFVESPSKVAGGYKPRRIIDADGDGVEDNVKHDQYTLDKFREMVFSPAVEDIHNTRNGELPGHHRWGDHPEPGVNIHAEADAKDAKAKADKAAEEKKQTEASKKSFVQTGELSNWGMVLTSSENMEKYELLQTGSTFKANDNEIFDADGDGVEDNVQYTHGELDNFFFPTVFNTAEDVYNTRHGNYPGHRQKEFYDAQSPPESMELVKGAW
jgi:hypothetical protein